MKKYLHLIVVLLFFVNLSEAQIIRPFTARYYNPSVRGNIVYVSNSIISTAGVGSGDRVQAKFLPPDPAGIITEQVLTLM